MRTSFAPGTAAEPVLSWSSSFLVASALGWTLAGAALAGCENGDAPSDAASPEADAEAIDAAPVTSDGGTPDAYDIHMGLRLPACESTDPAPSTPFDHHPSTLVTRWLPHVPRLSAPLAQNPATEAGEALARGMNLHVTDVAPGAPHVRRTDLGASTTATSARRSLAWFVHYSDFQLVDDESPARLARLDNTTATGGLRAQEAYLPHVVSAMNRTVARIQASDRPFDMGIITGDCADSAQANEIEWVLELMNGATDVEVDSGDDDDPIPGPDNDPKDPFDATAFPAPWLFVPGNHDVEVVGISVPSPDFDRQATGTRASTGTRDYRRWYAPVTTGDVPADPNRRLVSRDDIVGMLQASDATGPHGPPGHGYGTSTVSTTHGANFAYDVVPGLLRVLAIDTSDPTGGANGLLLQSAIDGWLEPELDRAVRDGVLVMLASHHSARSIDPFEGQVGTTPVAGALTTEQIQTYVASRPEIVAWLVGHTHDNQIRAVRGPDAAHPGYWEIMTSAIADFPGQARTIEVVGNGDGTLSIFGTLLDFDTDSCFERRYRALLQSEWAGGWFENVSSDPADFNVELVRAIPPSAAAAVARAMGTSPARLESLSTLVGDGASCADGVVRQCECAGGGLGLATCAGGSFGTCMCDAPCTMDCPCTVGGAAGARTDTCTGTNLCLCPGGADTCATGGVCEALGDVRYTVYVGMITVPARKPSGDCWDGPTCGDPEPFVRIVRRRGTTNTTLLETMPGTNTTTWNFAATSTPFELAVGDRILLSIWDDDVALDDVIAPEITTEVTAETLRARAIQLPAPSSGITLELRLTAVAP